MQQEVTPLTALDLLRSRRAQQSRSAEGGVEFEPSIAWQFNELDAERFARWFWRLPRWLVEARRFVELWRPYGARRGGGVASSILPVLALHTRPANERDESYEHGWTRERVLSHRRGSISWRFYLRTRG